MSPLTVGASEALLRRNRHDHYWRMQPNALGPATPVDITEPARTYTGVAVDMAPRIRRIPCKYGCEFTHRYGGVMRLHYDHDHAGDPRSMERTTR